MTERPRRRRLGLPRALALSFASMAGGGACAFAGACVLTGAWRLAAAGGAAALLALALALAIALSARGRRAACLLAMPPLAVLLLFGWPRSTAPPPDGAIQSLARDGGSPSVLFGALPEREWAALGAWLFATKGERTSAGAFPPLYAEAEGAGPFTLPRPVFLDAFLFDRGHLWLVAPASRAPAPCLVVLHGGIGNLGVLPVWFGKAARERGWVAVFPTSPGGLWHDGPARVEAALATAAAVAPIDRRRVALVGVSAGTFGVFDCVSAAPGGFAGVATICGPWLHPPAAASLAGTRVLAVHGTQDERAPIGGVRAGIRGLAAARVDAALEELAADHFVLVTHRERAVARVVEWAQETFARVR